MYSKSKVLFLSKRLGLHGASGISLYSDWINGS